MLKKIEELKKQIKEKFTRSQLEMFGEFIQRQTAQEIFNDLDNVVIAQTFDREIKLDEITGFIELKQKYLSEGKHDNRK